jgi:hypothetical protein
MKATANKSLLAEHGDSEADSNLIQDFIIWHHDTPWENYAWLYSLRSQHLVESRKNAAIEDEFWVPSQINQRKRSAQRRSGMIVVVNTFGVLFVVFHLVHIHRDIEGTHTSGRR